MTKPKIMTVASLALALACVGLALYTLSASQTGLASSGEKAAGWEEPRVVEAQPLEIKSAETQLMAQGAITSPIPTAPPVASHIAIGSPDVDNMATVYSRGGAVEPNSMVLIANLNSRNIITATVDYRGWFSARLYAPRGSQIIVKYDRLGDRVRQIWQDASKTTKPDISYINALPGAILTAGPLPASETETEFYTAGSFVDKSDSPSQWAGWALEGALHIPPSTPVSKGQRIYYDATIHITSPAINCSGLVTFTSSLNMRLRYLYGGDGVVDPWGVWFTANLFTPTGLPIEHEAEGAYVPVGNASFGVLSCETAIDHTIWGSLEAYFDVPTSIPDGTYLVEAFVNHNGVPRAMGLPLLPVWYHPHPTASLPPLTVGEPAPPRIPWMLLGNYPLNGHRGVQAQQDVGKYAMPTRVVFPPQRVVVPMLDERSGEPITYLLEPGCNWLSSTDRRLPNPLKVPFKLPSGSLTVNVYKPDGSHDTLSAPILQSSVRTPTIPSGDDLAFGTGHVGDMYHLTTLDEDFRYQFDQYGPHTIVMEGMVEDVYGNEYAIFGTYDVLVARILDLDPAQLPSTPYVVGDYFAPGLHVFPPMPAEVTIEIVHMPYSDPYWTGGQTFQGEANRFGYFFSNDFPFIFEYPGEFRVDINATYTDTNGTLWAGSMTWGNVVEGSTPLMTAHGRRGMDYHDSLDMSHPDWFKVQNLLPAQIGIEVYYPYWSGDIHWGNEDVQLGDSIHSIITVEDNAGPDGQIYNILKGQFSKSTSKFRWPPDDTSSAGLNARIQINEAPLYITTQSGIDAGVKPDEVDLWGYAYNTSERPDVHVREIISEDNMGTAYWRFNDTYGYQIGEPADGDQPGDIKWEFGGAVLRMPDLPTPVNEYAVYSSLWVLLPHGGDSYGGARVTTPFRGANGVSIDGGPILTLLGEDIDMLFLPKGVRPGDILEVGDMVSFSGHVGPPLDSRVDVVITSPSNVTRSGSWHANKVGWLYDPDFDFVADEPGRWTVEVFVEHDRDLAYAAHPWGCNCATGTVLGTSGVFSFYVVQPDSLRMMIRSPMPGFLPWPDGRSQPDDRIELIIVRCLNPAGVTTLYYTIHDKGVVMAQGSLAPSSSGTTWITYDPEELHQDFPMLSLTAHEGKWQGLSDEVTISVLAVGSGPPQANVVTLIGEEVFVKGVVMSRTYLPLLRK